MRFDNLPNGEVAGIIYEAAHKVVLTEALKELGLQEDIKILEIEAFRWTVSYDQSSGHPDFARNMIKLEALLQKKTKRPIDLRLPTIEDKNKRTVRNVLNEPK